MKNLWQTLSDSWDVSGFITSDGEKIYVLTSSTNLMVISFNSMIDHELEIEIQDLLDMTLLVMFQAQKTA